MKETKICPYCGKEYIPKSCRSKHCGSIQCRLALAREIYNSTTYIHICEECGKQYESHHKKPKENLCLECKRKRRTYTQIEKKLICRQCGKVLKINLVNLTRPGQHIEYVTCEDCKQKNRQKQSQYMQLHNPSYNGESLTEEQWKAKQESRAIEKQYEDEHKDELRAAVIKAASERMRLHNPMHNPEVVAKNVQTRAAKVLSGQLVYKKGPNNHNWKGNNGPVRSFIRLQLAEWRKKYLAEANYTCQLCGATNCELHVHHLESFFDIVNKCADQLNLDIKSIKRCDPDTMLPTSEYLALEKAVLDYHDQHDVGIVVCVNCHDLIDPQLKKPKKNKKVKTRENNKQKNY